MARRILTVGGLAYAGFWIFLILQQLNLTQTQVPCWFYDPALSESSLSELLTLVGYLLAIGLCVHLWKRSRQKAFLVVAAFCGALFLEECNWGMTLVRLFSGNQLFEGKALHNLVEDQYTPLYHQSEYLIQLGLFAAVYFGFPGFFLRRPATRQWGRAVLSTIPSLLWAFFLIRETQWEHIYGHTLYPNHVCVSIDEEILETLFPFSLSFELLLLRWWPNRETT